MIFGFTGTQEGMTREQDAALRSLLRNLAEGNDEFHHGDCIGADAQAHDIAEEFRFFIVVHPPINSSKRAYKGGHVVRAPLPYLARNREIVWAADYVIGAPKEAHEVLRSGTWSTLRFALKQRVPFAVIRPSGEVVKHEIR